MKLGYTLIYVPNVVQTVEFYERAFLLARRFVHESGQYAEMETGASTLSFASEELAQANDVAIRPNRSQDVAAGFELCFIVRNPKESFDLAVAGGAAAVKGAEQKPWGQVVAYVRDLNGCLIELCTEITG